MQTDQLDPDSYCVRSLSLSGWFNWKNPGTPFREWGCGVSFPRSRCNHEEIKRILDQVSARLAGISAPFSKRSALVSRFLKRQTKVASYILKGCMLTSGMNRSLIIYNCESLRCGQKPNHFKNNVIALHCISPAIIDCQRYVPHYSVAQNNRNNTHATGVTDLAMIISFFLQCPFHSSQDIVHDRFWFILGLKASPVDASLGD